jgi:HK97 family phage prohead protease
VRIEKIERKIEYFPILGGEIKEFNDAKGTIGGYLNYINNIDYGKDRTMKGAFQTTLKDSYARKSAQSLDFLWPYLWNHDYNIIPPGGIFDADEDKKGLYTKTQFNLDIQMGRELYSSFKMGTMKKQSMGYKAIQVEWVKENGESIRNLLEVAVMEGSAVVFPMNDLAQVDTVKNRRTFYMPPRQKQETTPVLTKDYAASYAQVTQQDWVSDLWNLWYPLKNEIITAFQIGDSPEADVKAALAQFSTAVLAYVQQGIALDMTEYLQPDDTGNSPMMWMSAEDNPDTKAEKAGSALSAANHAILKKAMDGVTDHVKSVRGMMSAAARANALQGYPVYPTSGADDPTPEHKQDDVKEEDAAQAALPDERSLLDDMAAKLGFQNAFRGI